MADKMDTINVSGCEGNFDPKDETCTGIKDGKKVDAECSNVAFCKAVGAAFAQQDEGKFKNATAFFEEVVKRHSDGVEGWYKEWLAAQAGAGDGAAEGDDGKKSAKKSSKKPAAKKSAKKAPAKTKDDGVGEGDGEPENTDDGGEPSTSGDDGGEPSTTEGGEGETTEGDDGKKSAKKAGRPAKPKANTTDPSQPDFVDKFADNRELVNTMISGITDAAGVKLFQHAEADKAGDGDYHVLDKTPLVGNRSSYITLYRNDANVRTKRKGVVLFMLSGKGFIEFGCEAAAISKFMPKSVKVVAYNDGQFKSRTVPADGFGDADRMTAIVGAVAKAIEKGVI